MDTHADATRELATIVDDYERIGKLLERMTADLGFPVDWREMASTRKLIRARQLDLVDRTQMWMLRKAGAAYV